MAGRIEVVATPIGNLADLSPRAREALARADVIAAEDTRHTGALLQALGLSRPLLSLHEHNERLRIDELLARLARGEIIALVSDAGTPLVSDPGYALIAAALAAGYAVNAIPGPSAVLAALSIAGLPTDRFCFEGFLPVRGAGRVARLAHLATEPRTLVFFEAPHRIVATLTDLAATFGAERRAVVARELSKTFETVYRDTLAGLLDIAGKDANLARGEITLVVAGAPAADSAPDDDFVRRALELLRAELPTARAAAVVAQLTGRRKSDVYAMALQLAKR
ncbi:MAG: 16S rRNA (cytidine(1402)-2'-O)-methyltransferase [Pseudomonadota bacterium]